MDNQIEKVTPWGLKRPKRLIHDFLITDESNPGVEVPFKLKDPNISILLKIGSVQEEYTELYLTPNEGGELCTLPSIDGEPIELDENIIILACSIHGLQIPNDPLFYSVEEIIGHLVAMESGMLSLTVFVNQIADKFQGLLKNPTGAVILPQSPSIPEPTIDTLS